MDERERRLKRLRYQSWHRGCKETDVVLGNYFDHHAARWDEAAIARYEALLNEDDHDIWRWVAYRETPPNADFRPIVEQLRLFHHYASY